MSDLSKGLARRKKAKRAKRISFDTDGADSSNGPSRREPEGILEARFVFTTPCFIRGNENDKPELRQPSIHGALRFWWRALAWPATLGENPERLTTQRLATLRNWEDALFGAASQQDDGRETKGQGLWRFTLHKDTKSQSACNRRPKNPGLIYLLGQGLYDHKKGLLRCALDIETGFTLGVTVLPAREGDPGDLARSPSIEQVLRVFGLLGGLGARARRGFGSVRLEALSRDGRTVFDPPPDPGAYIAALDALFHEMPARDDWEETPYTALNKGWRIGTFEWQKKNALETLEAAGMRFMMLRSNGRTSNGKRLIGSTEIAHGGTDRRFWNDHQVYKSKEDKKDTAPERIAFGLPHNYKNWSIPGQNNAQTLNRRASPAMLHIHSFADGRSIAVWTLAPARFLDRMDDQGRHTIPATPHDLAFDPAALPETLGMIFAKTHFPAAFKEQGTLLGEVTFSKTSDE